jgi:phosphoribosylaminoimidazole-succinocarboxamide synthase
MDTATTPNVLTDIDLPYPGRRVGKVRVSYDLGNDRRLFVTTDRLSAFDKIVAAVPHKGRVLNELSWWWFNTTRHIVDNHAIALPDPNVLVAVAATPLPVEVIVRGHITGVTSTSLWKQYAEGNRVLYGHRLPDGIRKNAELPSPLITPTTKAELGAHDEPLTCAEVAERGLVEPALWNRVQDAALAIFEHGRTAAAQAGLILADTKYEFGLGPDGRLLLIDEVHTPDSSRFWERASYEERLAAEQEPESLDKEVVRRALLDAGYKGEGTPPVLADDVWNATSERYLTAYSRLTGAVLDPVAAPTRERVLANLQAAGL